MISSINDKIRSTIINENSIPLTLLNIENLDIEESQKVIRLFLADYYKIKFFDAILTNDFSFLNIFNKNIDDLIEKCLKDTDLLVSILECSNEFNLEPYSYKIKIIETLDEYNQDKKLMEISKLHLLDKISYKFNYNLEDFKEYYIDFISKANENKKNKEVSIYIAEKLLEYKDTNYDKFKKFILEFINTYYKWTIFTKENGDKNSLYREDYLYLEIIKFNSIDDLIKYMEKDFNFLVTLTENYLYYSTSDKDISEPFINEYFNNNVNSEIQKKLQLKRD